MQHAGAIGQIESKYRSLASVLDERSRRHWAASEARAYGWGGVSAVSDATGMSVNTIRKGLAELEARDADPDGEVTSRLRKAGAGRKRLSETDPELSVELDHLVAPLTRGDPQSALRWTCKRHQPLGARVVGPRAPDQRQGGGALAGRSRLQPAGQPQDPGG